MRLERHKTHKVHVRNISIGGDSPIVVQSMTNTETKDVPGTVEQIIQLFIAGSEIVRITVNDLDAARAVPKIRNELLRRGYDIPLVGCFHYNGHRLFKEVPECAVALDKLRVNPGNVGFGEKRDTQFESFIETAIKHNKPVRIGVNWGSLDQGLLTALMEKNSASANPQSSNEVEREALILSALNSAKHAEHLGLAPDKIVVSCKTSKVVELIPVYQELAKRSNYALHLGLTEAGQGRMAAVSTAAALSILLQQGIGDTIRASITPKIGESRIEEVKLCQEILQALDFKAFMPTITACPGCGRTTSTYFQKLATDIKDHVDLRMNEWSDKYKGVENLKIAVMGCIVNGPGESKHADIGISLPGSGENPVAPVFIDGKKQHTLRGDNIFSEFKVILENYIEDRFKARILNTNS